MFIVFTISHTFFLLWWYYTFRTAGFTHSHTDLKSKLNTLYETLIDKIIVDYLMKLIALAFLMNSEKDSYQRDEVFSKFTVDKRAVIYN